MKGKSGWSISEAHSSKRSVCRQYLPLRKGYGIRTVADGVETTSDFLSVREMGFDLVQGYLFGKPVSAKKFAKTVLSHAI
jgi:EAL domain-containing protein (putative c-di-GMP-specific phosphodiesterase class I)